MSIPTTLPQAAVTDAPTATPRLPGVWQNGWQRTRYELRVFFREMDQVIFSFGYPVIMLAIFASVFAGEVAPGVDFAQYFLPGMAATGIMLSSFQTVAITIAMDRDDNTLKRLHGTPMPLTSYFLGKVGQVLVASVAQMVLLLAVARFAFDVPMPEAGRWLTFGWIFLLGNATGTVLGVAFSSLPRSGKSASAVVIPIVLVLQFTSGVFFPFESLPSWMQDASAVFPLKWLAQGMRAVFLPDSFVTAEVTGEWELGLVALILVVWLVVGLVAGIRSFRWTRRDDG